MSELEKIIAEKHKNKVVRIGIYKIESPTGRVYVGQSKDIRKRWMSYVNLRCKSQPKLMNSFKKHGVRKHCFTILQECKVEELDDLEVFWGLHYKVLKHGNLNSILGAAGVSKSYKTKVVKNLLPTTVTAKAVIQYTLNGEFVKEWPSIADAARSLNINETGIQKCCKGLRCRYKNFIWRFKVNNKIEGFKLSSPKKPIIQMDLKGNFIKEWPSAADASRDLGIPHRGINSCCNKTQATSKGYIWAFKEDLINRIPPPQQRRVILQYTISGDFVKEWPSIREASKNLPNCKNIYRVLTGKSKTCGGFVWKYKD